MQIPQTQRKITCILIFVLFVVSFIVYLPTLFNGFVYDDMEQVLANPWIVDFTHLGDIFFTPSWSFMKETTGSNYYRPIMHLGFLLERHIFGLSPKAFHLFNIILHSLNSVLLFFIASALFKTNEDTEAAQSSNSIYLAFAAALIFSLHPINSEVVNWISALPELSYVIFLLSAFYIYITLDKRPGERRRVLWQALSVIFFFLALLSKETAMAFLLFIWCYDLLSSSRGPSFIKRYRRYIPYILTAIIYMALRTYALGGFAQKKMVDTSFFESLINIFPTLLRYIGKLIWPVNLSIIYSYEPYSSIFAPAVIFSFLAVLLALLALVLLRKREGLIFSLLWIIIPLLPVLYIPLVSVGGFADRYLYLPCAGFAIFLAVLFRSLYLNTQRRKIVKLLLLSLLSLYTVLTVSRSMVWKDSMSLWSDTVAKAPDSVVVNLGLAAAYRAEGNNELALKLYKRVVRLDPFNYKPYYNMALIYTDIGDEASAAVNYLNTIRLNPLNDHAYYNLAVLYERAGEVAKAIHFYKETLRVNPSNKRVRANLANAYKSTNDPSAALRAYKDAVFVSPLDATAHYNLAWSFQESGDNLSAINSFKEAIRLDPESAQALYGLAWVYHFIGDIPLAERYYKETVRVRPERADAYFNLGLIYTDRGDFEAAVENFTLVLEIDPNYREAKARLEKVKAIGRNER